MCCACVCVCARARCAEIFSEMSERRVGDGILTFRVLNIFFLSRGKKREKKEKKNEHRERAQEKKEERYSH